MLKSILYHVANIHTFPEFHLFPKCLHGEIEKRQWIPVGMLIEHNTFILKVGGMISGSPLDPILDVEAKKVPLNEVLYCLLSTYL